jgi:hypothetical protein
MKCVLVVSTARSFRDTTVVENKASTLHAASRERPHTVHSSVCLIHCDTVMAEEKLVRFPLLAEEGYEPNTFMYNNQQNNGMPRLADWIQVFRSSVPGFRRMAEKDESVEPEGRSQKAAEFARRCLPITERS